MENLENFGFPLSGQAKLLITSVKKNKSEIKNILLSFLIHQVSISSYCFLLWLSKINELPLCYILDILLGDSERLWSSYLLTLL